MAKYKCNSCGATYTDIGRDGVPYRHTCGPTSNPNYQPDPGKPNHDPETHVERANARNENTAPNLQYHEGKPVIVTRDPNDATRQNVVPAESLIISEGLGRTLIEA
jgi:hypothetical protein